MEILNEKSSEEYLTMDCEFTQKEVFVLVKYFDEHCVDKELQDIKVNWAINNLLKIMMECECNGR